MVAKGNRSAEISIYGDIGAGWFGDGISAANFAKDLKSLGDVANLTVKINSMGGFVDDGLTIYRNLVDHPAHVTTQIDGMAASIASAIAMAGDEIIIAESATMMIHEAWGGMFGTAAEFEAYARVMAQSNDTLAKVYADRTGNTVAKVKGWMSAEPGNLGTWFDAQGALKNGFATAIAENKQQQVAAHASMAQAQAVVRERMASLAGALNPNQQCQPAPNTTIDGGQRPAYDAAAARVREVSLRTFANTLRT